MSIAASVRSVDTPVKSDEVKVVNQVITTENSETMDTGTEHQHSNEQHRLSGSMIDAVGQ